MSIDLRRPECGGALRAGRLASLLLALGFGQVAGQERPPGLLDARLDSVSRRIRSISPISGPPGTSVTLRTGSLPAITPMRIGIGATHFGFEELGQVMTDETGELSLTVQVPSWAQRELSHRFIVFDFYFVPLALSDVFHVTGPDGTVQRQGLIVAEDGDGDGECRAMRGEDGMLYALEGDTRGYQQGDTVVVDGTVTESSGCAQGVTLEVVRIRAGGGNR